MARKIPIMQVCKKPKPIVLRTHPRTGRVEVIWHVSFCTLHRAMIVSWPSCTAMRLWSGDQ